MMVYWFLKVLIRDWGKREDGKSLKIFGEPGRTRTYNPLIKSQLLYH